jgi:FKBP-type peptidyl-prolyl cis-trans isomerase
MTDQLQTADRTPADQPTSAEIAANARRRGQAVVGALSGVAVVLVLVAVFVGVKVADKDKPSTPAAAPAASAPAQQPEAQQPEAQPTAPAQDPTAQQPAPADTPAALAKRPAVAAGGSKKLTALKVTSLVKGTGPKVTGTQTITVNYVLASYPTGKVIEASWDQGQAIPLPLNGVIPGFAQGLTGVPVGSRVQLDIPAKLAYGDKPTGGQPAGDLRFIVDILAAQ